MRKRCTYPGATGWKHYGSRGIKVCDRWDSFEAFLSDMGPCPDEMSIDRIDPNGNYEPGNCRWADRYTQAQNSSAAKLTFAIAEEIRSLKASGIRTRDIAQRYGVNKSTVERVLSGQRWSAIDAALAAKPEAGK
jgi:predicted DNA-binding protein (UPF0251 family)